MRVMRAWVLLAITAITLLFALSTGHPMFWRSTYVFLALLVIAAAWVLALGRGVQLEARRSSLRAIAGGGIIERIIVRRRSSLQKGVAEVVEQTTIPADPPSVLVDLDEDTVPVELEVPCPARGIYQIGPTSFAFSDPFGLFQLRRTVGEKQTLIVHPATVDLPGFVLLPADLPGEGPRHVRSNHVTTSAFGVRDYAHGDALNRISWKATAHHDRIMVKEFEVEPANNVWVLLDLDRRTHSGTGERGTEELSIRVAASICRRYSEANYPVGFMTWGEQPVTIPAQRGHLLYLLDAMAGVRSAGSRPLMDLIGDLHSRAGRYTSVAIVTPAGEGEWLNGVAYLLERRARITVVCVAGERGVSAAADRVAGLSVPVYVARHGTEGPEVTSVFGQASHRSPHIPGMPARGRR